MPNAFHKKLMAEVADVSGGKKAADVSAANKYRSEPQQRILKVLLHLFGHEINGLTTGDVSKGLGIAASTVTKDLANLEEAGLAERLPDGLTVRISPRLGLQCIKSLEAFNQAEQRLKDLRSRYTNQSTQTPTPT